MWTQAVRRVLVFVICLCAEPHLSSARRGLHFLAPSAWAEVSSGLMPVLARLPLDYRFHVATLQVDGETLDSTPVVVRRRWWEGKGVDLIASVDVSQMTPGLHRLAAIIEPTESGMTRLDTPKSKETVRAEAWFVLRPRPHRLSLYVVDEVGEPRYGKVQIMGDGEQFTIGNPHDGLSDPSQRDVPRTSLLVTPDGGTEFLASGRYRVLASAGIRDGIDHREIQVDGDASLTLTVPRLISTPDETTADLHVHTALSSDAFISDTQRFHALAAADVEAAVISDHNKMRDPVPALEMLGMSEDLEAITGVEFRIGPAGESIGHGNAFPLKPGVAALKPKNRSPGEVFDAWRVHHQANPVEGDSTPVLIQLNHPRGIQFRSDRKHRTDAHALFEELDFNPKLPLRH